MAIKHGMCGTATYRTWNIMIQRCTNPKNAKYKSYGAAGITVCDEWQQSFDAFLRDMGERPKGTTIDRIDGSRGYERGNCRWSTPAQQQRNIKTNRPITLNGKTRLLCDWASLSGLQSNVIAYRVARGWPEDQVLRQPDIGNRVKPCRSTELTVRGKTMTYSEWERKTGVLAQTIRMRIARGFTPEQAVTPGLVKRRAAEQTLCLGGAT